MEIRLRAGSKKARKGCHHCEALAHQFEVGRTFAGCERPVCDTRDCKNPKALEQFVFSSGSLSKTMEGLTFS